MQALRASLSRKLIEALQAERSNVLKPEAPQPETLIASLRGLTVLYFINKNRFGLVGSSF